MLSIANLPQKTSEYRPIKNKNRRVWPGSFAVKTVYPDIHRGYTWDPTINQVQSLSLHVCIH